MTIVTYHYRPKRPPRKKRKQPPIATRIVTPPKLKPIKGRDPAKLEGTVASRKPCVFAGNRKAAAEKPSHR